MNRLDTWLGPGVVTIEHTDRGMIAINDQAIQRNRDARAHRTERGCPCRVCWQHRTTTGEVLEQRRAEKARKAVAQVKQPWEARPARERQAA